MAVENSQSNTQTNAQMETNICKYCNVDRELNMFRKNRLKCKECERSHGREYRQSDHGKQKATTWVQNNQKKMAKLQADWHQNNKVRRNNECNERYKTDEIFRIKKSIRTIMHNCVYSDCNTIKKLDHLQCTNQFFKKWIIDNMGEISLEDMQMDHVLPYNTFEFKSDEDRLVCLGWYNVMPVTSKFNMTKKDKIIKEQIENQIERINKIKHQLLEDQINLINKYQEVCNEYLQNLKIATRPDTQSNTQMETRLCKYCNIEHEIRMFREGILKCKNCEREKSREYKRTEKGKQKAREWNEKNSDHMKIKKAEWQEKNKDEIRKASKKKYTSDLAHQLKAKAKSVMNNALKTNSTRTCDLKYINCSAGFFQRWINANKDANEDNFYLEYTIPVDRFELEQQEQVDMCFGWYNITPVSHIQDKTDIVTRHLQNLENFKEDPHYQKQSEKIDQYKRMCATQLDAGNSSRSQLPLLQDGNVYKEEHD